MIILVRYSFVLILAIFIPANFLFSNDKDFKLKYSSTTNETCIPYHINSDDDFKYSKPQPMEILKNSFKDVEVYYSNTFKRENYKNISLMASLTGLLIAYDQPIIDEAQRFAKRIHLSSDNNTKSILEVFGFPIWLPTDLSSGLYYLGDGLTSLIIFGSFTSYGLIKNDNRALQTAGQMVEGLLSTGIVISILKHVTGRESPCRASTPGGIWRFFPNQIEYHKHVSSYDAYPSGHLATAMMTLTVISENYPEKKFIKPIGYTLMTLLGFQMLNNGVHWISDYPLGLAIGYSFGKIAVARGRTVVKRSSKDRSIEKKDLLSSVDFIPVFYYGGGFGVGVNYRF